MGSFNEENVHVHDAHNRATTNHNTAQGTFYLHILISKRSDNVLKSSRSRSRGKL